MKLFENECYDGYVLPINEFKLFLDVEKPFPPKDDEGLRERIRKQADEILTEEIPQLYASQYMRFMKPGDGDRLEYQTPYFKRRSMLVGLLYGELFCNDGKYTQKLIDVLWLILEESTWVVPAHNRTLHESICGVAALPDIYDNNYGYFDLFSSETASLLALVYYFMKDRFDKSVSAIINGRILYALKTRMLDPFLKYDNMWWMGFYKDRVNNWNPWIVSNVLTVAALCEDNLDRRKRIVSKALLCLDNFVKGYKPDGGCSEGPGYWDHAGAALFVALEVLYDITDGKIDKFGNSLIYNMMDYIRKVNLSGEYFTCFADGHLKAGADFESIYRMGLRTHNQLLCDFAMKNIEELTVIPGFSQHIKHFKNMLIDIPSPKNKYEPSEFEVLPDLQVAVMRSARNEKATFTVGIKGGNNAEDHNHNDVGNFVVYRNGEPLILDMGVRTYDRSLFSSIRYTLFPLYSKAHNLPVINGMGEINGKDYRASGFEYDENKKSVKVSYADAYENKQDIEACERTLTLEGETVKICDRIVLCKDGEVYFNLYLFEKPEYISENKVVFTNSENTLLSVEGAKISIEEVPITDAVLIKDFGKNMLYKLVLTPEKGKEFTVNTTITK